MLIDYRRYKPGIALAAAILLTRCPLCGRACQERQSRKGYRFRYVHEVRVERRFGGDQFSKRRRARNVVVVVKGSLCRESRGERQRREAGLKPRKRATAAQRLGAGV